MKGWERLMPRLLLMTAVLACVVIGCQKQEAPVAATETSAVASAPAESQQVPSSSAAPGADASAIEAGNDVTGAYFAMTKLPADFSELDHLGLATIDENAAPAPLNGFLRPKAQRAADYALVKPALDGKRLTFTTASVDGVQYAFDGAFQVVGNFPANPPGYDTVVLAGTLTKMRDGKSVASTPVNFRYEAGG